MEIDISDIHHDKEINTNERSKIMGEKQMKKEEENDEMNDIVKML